MAFDDLAFKYSTGADKDRRRAWCARCFSLRWAEAGDVNCPSCGARLRDISEDEAEHARAMLARLDTVMSARLAAVSNATGPFSLAPAVAGLRELAALSRLGTAPVAPRDESNAEDDGAGAGSGTGAGAGAGAGAAAGSGAGFAPGDFVADNEVGALLARLMNEYGENSGAPAASKSAVDSFPVIEVESAESLPKEVGVRVPGIPGEIAAIPAAFGPAVPSAGITGALVVGDPVLGDAPFANAAAMDGAVVLLQRGKVGFADKARRAQAAGAVAVIVGQTADVWPYTMTDSKTNGEGVDIPVIMLRKEHAARLLTWEPKAPAKSPETGAADTRRHVTLVSTASNSNCVVCQCDYEPGDTVKQMPCQHLYHADCIEQWLGSNNSCPICRFEVATDDADYESRRKRHAHDASDTSAYDGWFL